MPRPNKPRSMQSEANLARRIAFERAERGWSLEGLAKRMTEAGCAIQASAIYKTEKADPPRRISVDELVALSKVFGISVDDLLLPMDVAVNDRVREIMTDLLDAHRTTVASVEHLFRTWVRFKQYNDWKSVPEELLQATASEIVGQAKVAEGASPRLRNATAATLDLIKMLAISDVIDPPATPAEAPKKGKKP